MREFKKTDLCLNSITKKKIYNNGNRFNQLHHLYMDRNWSITESCPPYNIEIIDNEKIGMSYNCFSRLKENP